MTVIQDAINKVAEKLLINKSYPNLVVAKQAARDYHLGMVLEEMDKMFERDRLRR